MSINKQSQFVEAMFSYKYYVVKRNCTDNMAHTAETEDCSPISMLSFSYSKRTSQSLAGHITIQNEPSPVPCSCRQPFDFVLAKGMPVEVLCATDKLCPWKKVACPLLSLFHHHGPWRWGGHTRKLKRKRRRILQLDEFLSQSSNIISEFYEREITFYLA